MNIKWFQIPLKQNELRKLRDELTNQRDNLKSEVNELKNQKELTSQTINELKEENAKLEMKNATITQDMQSRWPDFFLLEGEIWKLF